MGFTYYSCADHSYCVDKLYQSCYCKINGTCKGSGGEKSSRCNQNTIDTTIPHRIFHDQHRCFIDRLIDRSACSKQLQLIGAAPAIIILFISKGIEWL